MKKELNAQEAKRLLDEAQKLNPGGWYEHSLNVGKAAHKIAEALGEDADKAEAYGYIHDIGRKVGRCSLKHTYEGYKYMSNLGYEDAARICLTHSFFENRIEGVIGEWDIGEKEKNFIENYIKNTEFNIYDRIIQMSDCICLSTGVTILERRMVDVFFRYGFNEYTEYNFKIRLELQDELEEKLGYSLYKLFKNELIDEFEKDRVNQVIRFKNQGKFSESV